MLTLCISRYVHWHLIYLPVRFASAQAKTIRSRIYNLAAKVIRHGRKLCLKLKASHQALLNEIFCHLRQLGQIQAQAS